MALRDVCRNHPLRARCRLDEEAEDQRVGSRIAGSRILGPGRWRPASHTGWAMAFNTPFKLWKRYSNWEGGTADPMIVSWPARITSGTARSTVSSRSALSSSS
jgi:arylsulfatase A-like enzyme